MQDESINGVDDLLAAQGPDVVLDLFAKAQLADVSAPPGFRISESGVYSIDPTGEKDDIWICSPLYIIASTRSNKNEDWGQLLQFRDKDGNEHSWAMPMAMLAGDGSGYRERLLSMGLRIAPGRKARELLTTYIQTANPNERARCVERVGWYGSVFVLPDETIGYQRDEQVIFQSAIGAKHNITIAGTLDDWRQNVGCLCSGNSRLVFATSCAFAGPVLQLVGEGSGGFHFRGSSSTGKTTALLVAGSVWGGGGRKGYVQPWRTTANGLEAVAEIHNDGLLCLDELSQCDPREAGEIAYSLANGSGKLRMTRSIGARKKLEWELIFLSSGEISLATHVQTSGKRTRAGQEVRLCDLEADAGAGKGVFENIHGSASPSEFAQHLGEVSRRYYGSPIRAYLAALVDNRDLAAEAILRFRADFLKKQVPSDASGEVFRAASRFALVAAAGEFATAEGITGWQEGEAIEAAAILFKSWLTGRGTAGSGDAETAIRQVRAFIEAHGASRFQTIGEDASRVINRVGFSRIDDDGITEYLIFPEAFRNEVCKDFDSQMVARELAKRNYLEIETGSDRLTIRVRLPGLGKNQKRVYALKSSILETE